MPWILFLLLSHLVFGHESVKEGGNFRVSSDQKLLDFKYRCNRLESYGNFLRGQEIESEYKKLELFLNMAFPSLKLDYKLSSSKVCLTDLDVSDILAIEKDEKRFAAWLPNVTTSGQDYLFINPHKIQGLIQGNPETFIFGLMREELHRFIPDVEYSNRDFRLSKIYALIISSYSDYKNGGNAGLENLAREAHEVGFPYFKKLINNPSGDYSSIISNSASVAMYVNYLYDHYIKVTLDPEGARYTRIGHNQLEKALTLKRKRFLLQCDEDMIECTCAPQDQTCPPETLFIFRYNGALLNTLKFDEAHYGPLNFLKEQ